MLKHKQDFDIEFSQQVDDFSYPAPPRGRGRYGPTAVRGALEDVHVVSLGWCALSADSLPPGLASVRRAEAEAGLDAWPRQAMAKRV